MAELTFSGNRFWDLWLKRVVFRKMNKVYRWIEKINVLLHRIRVLVSRVECQSQESLIRHTIEHPIGHTCHIISITAVTPRAKLPKAFPAPRPTRSHCNERFKLTIGNFGTDFCSAGKKKIRKSKIYIYTK